jgi:hypothetical protein
MNAITKKTTGELLFDFLKYYSFEFFCDTMALYPALPDSLPSQIIQPKSYMEEDLTQNLQIFDPLNLSNNLTRSTNAQSIMSAFRYAFNSLLLECKCRTELLCKVFQQVKIIVGYTT